MDKTKIIKVCVSIFIIILAGALILQSRKPSRSISKNEVLKALESMPENDLIAMRQNLADQIEVANQSLRGDKPEQLIKFEEKLAQYDEVLVSRGVDINELKKTTHAGIPARNDESP